MADIQIPKGYVRVAATHGCVRCLRMATYRNSVDSVGHFMNDDWFAYCLNSAESPKAAEPAGETHWIRETLHHVSTQNQIAEWLRKASQAEMDRVLNFIRATPAPDPKVEEILGRFFITGGRQYRYTRQDREDLRGMLSKLDGKEQG